MWESPPDEEGEIIVGKRMLDVVVGSVLALAVTPLIVLLACLLAVQYRASPFFVQQRLGRAGRSFRIVKLRTLPPDAPAYADKYALREIDLPALPRILRQLHLDELPQLWLVPFGRMSLVGPRPEMEFLHQRMSTTLANQRMSVRPGCTGLWQVSVHAGELILEHPEYDLAYVARPNLRLDLWIMWHTLRMLCGGDRRVTLDALPSWATTSAARASATQRTESVSAV